MDEYRASPLRNLQGFWRVDGISEVGDADKGLNIRFVLSRLRDDYSDPYDATARLNTPSESLLLHPRWISVLTIGSVWEGVKRVSKPERLGRVFEVDTTQAQKLPFSHATKLNGKWTARGVAAADFLPKKDYGNLFATLYTIVPIIGDEQYKWMVIPHSELFRFFMAASGRIAKKVLRGETGELIDLSKTTDNDPVTIFERVKLKETEAKFFGRAQANRSFKEEMLQINKRITSISTNNSLTGNQAALALEANFPFMGKANLSVSGVPMQLANDLAIFTMEIHNCSYPLGFSSLIVESTGDQTSGGSLDGKGSSHKTYNVPDHDPDDEDDEIDNTPADAELQRREIPQNGSPFPEGVEISIEYRRSWEHTEKAASYPSEEVDVMGLTFGDGDFRATSKNMVGVDDVKEGIQFAARELKDFFEMLQGFEKTAQQKIWAVRSRAINGSIPVESSDPAKTSHFVTSLPMLASKKRTWHLITTEPKVRTRQLACIEVESNRHTQRFFYILEIELKDNDPGQCTVLVRRRDFKKIADDDFNSFLKLTCYKNRWPELDTDSWKKTKQRDLANHFKKNHLSKKFQHPKNREAWCASLTGNIFKWLKIKELANTASDQTECVADSL